VSSAPERRGSDRLHVGAVAGRSLPPNHPNNARLEGADNPHYVTLEGVDLFKDALRRAPAGWVRSPD